MARPTLDAFDSKPLFRGEVKRKGITVSRADGVALVIDSATYQRFEEDGTAVDLTAQAAIVDDADVYANLTAGTTAGKYYVDFSYVVGSWIGKARLKYIVV